MISFRERLAEVQEERAERAAMAATVLRLTPKDDREAARLPVLCLYYQAMPQLRTGTTTASALTHN
jgi:hypothetical protein